VGSAGAALLPQRLGVRVAVRVRSCPGDLTGGAQRVDSPSRPDATGSRLGNVTRAALVPTASVLTAGLAELVALERQHLCAGLASVDPSSDQVQFPADASLAVEMPTSRPSSTTLDGRGPPARRRYPVAAAPRTAVIEAPKSGMRRIADDQRRTASTGRRPVAVDRCEPTTVKWGRNCGHSVRTAAPPDRLKHGRPYSGRSTLFAKHRQQQRLRFRLALRR
jgi:hypothetical protein